MNRELKILMIKKDVTQTQLAAEYGISRGHLSSVISGRFESKPLKEFIAQRLDVPYRRIWKKAA